MAALETLFHILKFVLAGNPLAYASYSLRGHEFPPVLQFVWQCFALGFAQVLHSRNCWPPFRATVQARPRQNFPRRAQGQAAHGKSVPHAQANIFRHVSVASSEGSFLMGIDEFLGFRDIVLPAQSSVFGTQGVKPEAFQGMFLPLWQLRSSGRARPRAGLPIPVRGKLPAGLPAALISAAVFLAFSMRLRASQILLLRLSRSSVSLSRPCGALRPGALASASKARQPGPLAQGSRCFRGFRQAFFNIACHILDQGRAPCGRLPQIAGKSGGNGIGLIAGNELRKGHAIDAPAQGPDSPWPPRMVAGESGIPVAAVAAGRDDKNKQGKPCF